MSKQKNGGMPSRQRVVDAELRGRIVRGEYGVGKKLPPHTSLAGEFGVSTVTIQLVLKRMARDGFVEARPPIGTFVSTRPPHLSCYGLIFHNRPIPGPPFFWSRYFEALTGAATILGSGGDRRIVPFHGINERTDVNDRRQLIELIEGQRLAGLIFTTAPFFLKDTRILDAPGLPRVALEGGGTHSLVHSVGFEQQAWIRKAIDYFQSLGRRRVAVIVNSPGKPVVDQIQGVLVDSGMTCRSRWIQYASMRAPEGARHIVELLMNDRERPDCLLVMDDNFVEEVVTGLVATGVDVPGDIAVVGHANFPMAPTKILPIRLLGYDICTALLTCIRVIDQWRTEHWEKGGRTTLMPVWEEEYLAQMSKINGDPVANIVSE